MSSLYSEAMSVEMDKASEEALERSANRLAESALVSLQALGGADVAPERDTLVQEYRALLADAG